MKSKLLIGREETMLVFLVKSWNEYKSKYIFTLQYQHLVLCKYYDETENIYGLLIQVNLVQEDMSNGSIYVGFKKKITQIKGNFEGKLEQNNRKSK